MKTKLSLFKKTSITCILFFGTFALNAQTVSVTGGFSGTVNFTYLTRTCGAGSGMAIGDPVKIDTSSKPIDITISTPVNSITIPIAAMGPNGEAHKFDVLGQTSEVISVDPACTGLTVSGNILTDTSGLSSQIHGLVTVYSIVAFTQIRISIFAGSALAVPDASSLYIFPVTCIASTTAPTLSATSLTNTCPTTSVNLDALHIGSIPFGNTLVWSTDNNSSNGLSSTVATPTAVTAAVTTTYYAYYFDSVNTCYSPVSAGVVFTPTNCCNAGLVAPQF